MTNYQCLDCGKKSPMKKCRSCGSKRMVPYATDKSKKKKKTSVIDSSGAPSVKYIQDDGTDVVITNNFMDEQLPPPPDDYEAPVDIYSEIEAQVAKEVIDQSKPGLDVREKCDLVFSSPFVITNFICDQDKTSKYYPLADIWTFTEKEINEVVNYVYSIMEAYFPKVIDKIGEMDVVFLIFNGIAIFMIFGNKIVRTMKFFKEQEALKKQEATDNVQENTDGNDKQ